MQKQTDLCTCGHLRAAHFQESSQECSLGDCICGCFDKVDPLRAAAPELLEALLNVTQTLRLMNVVNTDGPSREEVRYEIRLAEAAIRKAKGE
jgi:hypothetical protein